jgi:hypothetical protein
MDMFKIDPAEVKRYVGSTLTSLILLVGILITQVDKLSSEISSRVSTEIKSEVLTDFNRDIEFSLDKQAEKLDKDPGDIKKADLASLTYHCQGFFGNTYVPTIPADRRVRVESLCDKVVALYIQ